MCLQHIEERTNISSLVPQTDPKLWNRNIKKYFYVMVQYLKKINNLIDPSEH